MNSEAKWFKYYGDIPKTLDYPDISMYRYVKNTRDEFPSYIAYDFMGKALTYEKFIDEVEVCAKALLAQGIKEGDAVTVCLPNVPQAVLMFYAINRIGAIASMVHPLSAENEIMFYLNETKSRIAITLSQFYSKFDAIKGRTGLEKLIVTKIADALPPVKSVLYRFVGKEPKIEKKSWVIPWTEFIDSARQFVDAITYEGRGEDSAVILFSGGTTGTSKGILLTNLNFNALAMQTAAAACCEISGSVMLSIMPVFHGFGLGVGIHTILAFGGKCVLVPRLNVDEFPALFKKHKPNFMAGVPTVFEAMMRNKEMQQVDLSSLKGLFSGGDSLSIELKKKIDK